MRFGKLHCGIPNGVCFKAEFVGAVHRVTDLQKNPVRISKDEADEQQAHSTIPETEQYTDTLTETSANKAKTKSLTRMPAAEKAMKERDRTQMPVAKKEKS